MAEVISRRSIVYDISFDAKGARQGAQQTEKALKDVNKAAGDVGSSFTNLGKQIAGAFALEAVVRQIAQFTAEAFELGLKAEGVRKAFQNLNDPKLLDNLRKATKGTVDDFVLMQATVKADKFKIPLTELATLFEFARRRAKETGQEVGFLVESIIDGIGKKSPMILDNLGLRAQDLQNEFAKTGDFAKAAANVISEEMRLSGAEIETNAEKVEKLRTSWQNFKLDVGDALVSSIDEVEALLTGPISGNKKIFDAIFNLAADNVGLLDQLREKWAAQAEEARRAGEQMNAAQAGQNLFARLANVALKTTAFSLDEINERLKTLTSEFTAATDPAIQKELATQILRFEEMKKAIEALLNPVKNFRESFSGITALTKQEPTEIGTTSPGAADFVDTRDSENEALRLNNELTQANIDLKNEQLSASQSLFEMGADLLQQNADLGLAFFLLSRGLAVAEVIVKLQQTIAGLQAGAAPFLSNPFTSGPATALLAAQTAKARISAAVSIGTILSTTIPALRLAEGDIDISHPYGVPGKDSIPAMLMPGESVLTTAQTKKYRPIIEAIHSGNLDDVIRVNYLEPAMALKSLESNQSDTQALLDYSERFYRQLLETKDTNSLLKKIEYKIGQDHDRSFFLKLKRKF